MQWGLFFFLNYRCIVTKNKMTAGTVWCRCLDYTKAPAVLPPRASIPLVQMSQYYCDYLVLTLQPPKSLKDP